MVYSRFRARIILRVAVLLLLLGAEAYVLLETNWLVTSILVAGLILISVFELIHYIEKTNRDLVSFLQSIRNRDFTASFTDDQRGPSYAALKNAYNEIIREFRNLAAEKEVHYQYLQTVIENIGVALLCFNADEEVILMNQAAKNLLAKPYMRKIEALERIDADMLTVFRSLQSGEKELVKVVVKGELRQIAVAATEFKLMEDEYKLLSLQDIRSELDSRELDAWQKLIRVLTHEIMNSVTPLSTLSGVLKSYVQDDKGQVLSPEKLDQEALVDISMGLDTIESRTIGLLKFVKAYRSLLKLPKPKFEEVVVQDLLTRISILLKRQLAERNIQFEVRFPEEPLLIQADPELLEQVLINLVKNAMEAVSTQLNALIEIDAARDKGNRTLIRIRDNGGGIDEEYMDKIFVPFFTTKKDGSGIGLSLSRQVMQLHKGSITVNTNPKEGTAFTLEF